ncbi:MAG: DUF2203 family protein [SAR202 cluster bacterium]|nr:DUF2203 family protein [SAR202 cluster bacterium]
MSWTPVRFAVRIPVPFPHDLFNRSVWLCWEPDSSGVKIHHGPTHRFPAQMV